MATPNAQPADRPGESLDPPPSATAARPLTGTLPSTFCVMPFLALHVATTGTVAPCCEYNGTLGATDTDDLSEVWRSAGWAALRRDFLDGKTPDACWKCWDREAREGDSLRRIMNTALAGDLPLDEDTKPGTMPVQGPTYLDIRFSNLCNLKCRTCWHGSSSKWFADAKALGRNVTSSAEIRSFPTSEAACDAILPLLEGAKHLYFAGGEPLIMPEHYELLRRLIDQGRTDITLSYNTNMMVTAVGGQSIFDLWERFPNLSVTASVDGIAARGALIRSGFDWPDFIANVAALRQRCPAAAMSFGITVSAFNILTLTGLLDALAEEGGATADAYNLHSLQEPAYYRTQILPRDLKREAERRLRAYMARQTPGPGSQALMQKLDGLIRYMWAEDRSRALKRFRRLSKDLDALRDEDSTATLPELTDALTPSWTRRTLAALTAWRR